MAIKINYLDNQQQILWLGEPIEAVIQASLEHRFSNQEKSLIERETEVWGYVGGVGRMKIS